jgi:hypothetical protein
MAAHGNRSILGPVNPYDDGQKANAVDGGDDSLGQRGPVAPAHGDQQSPETQAQRDSLTAAYVESRDLASGFAGDGSAGRQLGRGADTFSTAGGDAGATGVGQVVAPNPLITRADGADPGTDGTGKAIG